MNQPVAQGRCWVFVGVLLIACGKVGDRREPAQEAGGMGASGGEVGAAGKTNAISDAGAVGEPEGGGAGGESSEGWSWQECGTIAGNHSGKLSWARFALYREAILSGYASGDVLLQHLGAPGPGERLPGLRGDAPSALSPDGQEYAELARAAYAWSI
jgi:hypothetical protein